MSVDFSDKELLFLYGKIKKEYVAMKNQRAIKIPKSELKFYEGILLKMENAYPALTSLPF